jgi:hypothetical protein
LYRNFCDFEKANTLQTAMASPLVEGAYRNMSRELLSLICRKIITLRSYSGRPFISILLI